MVHRSQTVSHRAGRGIDGDPALSVDGEVAALAVDQRGENLFVGSSRGQLTRVDLGDKAGPRVAETVDVPRRYDFRMRP